MRLPTPTRTVLTALALASAVGAVPAFAHTSVEKRSPGKGKTVSRSTGSASVTFNKTVRSGTLKVTGPGAKTYSIGKGGRDPRKVSRLLVELNTPLKSGGYKASWTIKAADGHTQRGSWTFKVK